MQGEKMKIKYKGYEVEAKREKSLGGGVLLYFNIFRKSDGYECLSSFEDSTETVRYKIKELKECIDHEHAEDDPWGELEQKLHNS